MAFTNEEDLGEMIVVPNAQNKATVCLHAASTYNM
jgi:hypothetical protein